MAKRKSLLSRIVTRRSLVRLNVWAQIVLSLVLLVVVNAIAAMEPKTRAWRIDCTYSGRHSITSKTRNILRSLTKKTRINVITGSGMARYGSSKGEVVPISDRIEDMVALYDAASPMIAARIVDFDRDKALCLQIQGQINDSVLPNTIIVQQETRHETIPFNFLVKGPQEAEELGQVKNVAFNIEAKLTGPVLKVAEEKRATVYVLSGHGELDIKGPEHLAMNAFIAALRQENYDVRSLNLVQLGEMPDDCDVLIIAAPKTPLQPNEIEILLNYLDTGGNLFVLLRPKFLAGETRSLGQLLSRYNVAILDGQVVVEEHSTEVPGRRLTGPQVFSQNFGKHPITDDLKTFIVYAEYACPLKTLSEMAASESALRAPGLARRYVVTPLISSSKESWAETNLRERRAVKDDRDTPGPCTIAVAVELRHSENTKSSGPRIVVSSSYSIVLDAIGNRYIGNRIFAVNAMGWLAHKEYKLGIPPQSSDIRRLKINKTSARGIYLIVIAMPLLAALSGGVVWWWRRRF